MSSIKAFECLTGHISGLCTLSGELSCKGGLSGKLSAVINYNVYSGEYEVVPSAFNTQVLPTANKIREGVTILGIEGTMSGSENMKPQAKTVTPSTAKQTILPDAEYNCLSQVEVEAIPYVEADNPAGGVTVTIAG